jgi:hypothetical protein
MHANPSRVLIRWRCYWRRDCERSFDLTLVFTLKFRVTSVTPQVPISGKCDIGRKAVRVHNAAAMHSLKTA